MKCYVNEKYVWSNAYRQSEKWEELTGRAEQCVGVVWTQGGNWRVSVGEDNSRIWCERCELERKTTNMLDGRCEKKFECKREWSKEEWLCVIEVNGEHWWMHEKWRNFDDPWKMFPHIWCDSLRSDKCQERERGMNWIWCSRSKPCCGYDNHPGHHVRDWPQWPDALCWARCTSLFL